MNLVVDVATIRNSFCPSCTICFIYVASSASLRKKNDAAHETIDHFFRNFAKFFTDFKNSFTSKLNNKCVVKQHITP